jgi:hypothetical protein
MASKIVSGLMDQMDLIPEAGKPSSKNAGPITVVIPQDVTPRPVPDIIGKSNQEAVKMLAARTFKARPDPANPSDKHIVVRITTQKGLWELVPESDVLDVGSEVAYELGLPVRLPDIIGKTSQEAEKLLKAAGFIPQNNTPGRKTKVVRYSNKIAGRNVKAGDVLISGTRIGYELSDSTSRREVKKVVISNLSYDQYRDDFYIEFEAERKKKSYQPWYSSIWNLLPFGKPVKIDYWDVGKETRWPNNGYRTIRRGSSFTADVDVPFKDNIRVKLIQPRNINDFYLGEIHQWDIETGSGNTGISFNTYFVKPGESINKTISYPKLKIEFEAGELP